MNAGSATQPAEPSADATTDGADPLLECLSIIARLHGQAISAAAFGAGLPATAGLITPELLVRAAADRGFSARIVKRRIQRISNLVLPAILLMRDGTACVLTRIETESAAEIILPDTGFGARRIPVAELAESYSGYCVFVHPRPSHERDAGDAPGSGSRFWFWGTLWRFRRYYAETIVAALLINVLALATSLFSMNVYDRVVPNNAVETLWVLAAGVLIAIGFEFLARTLRGYLLDVVGRKVDVLVGSRLFQQALAIRMDSRPASAGGLASNLRDFEAVRDFFTSATLTTLTDLPFVFLFAWIISLIAGPLGIIPVAAIAILTVAGLMAQIPLARIMQSHVKESSAKHGLLIEAIEAAETIKVLRAEGPMQRHWEDYAAITAHTALRSRFISALVVNFSMLVQQGVTVVLVVWGVHRIGEGLLTIGGLIACTILAGRAIAPLGQLAAILTRYQHSRAALKALDVMMKLPVERPVDRSFLHRPRLSGSIEFAGVSFAYPGQKNDVFQDVSFRVAPGERIAILGRVGAGKSTILRLVAGLYTAGKGSVLIDGTDSSQIDPADLRGNVGFLAQDVRLFRGTLRENLMLASPLADDEVLLAACRMSGLDRLVAQHPRGFDLPIGERGEGLSGGQRQAVGITRLLLAGPPIVLLDEPTASMDHTTEQAFIAQFRRFVTGRTLILSTHKPAMLELVERLVVLDGGKIVADGPRDIILKALMKPMQPAPIQ